MGSGSFSRLVSPPRLVPKAHGLVSSQWIIPKGKGAQSPKEYREKRPTRQGKTPNSLFHLLDIKTEVERGEMKAVGGVKQSGFRGSFKNQEYFANSYWTCPNDGSLLHLSQARMNLLCFFCFWKN